MIWLNRCVLILFCAVLLPTLAVADVVTATVSAGSRPYVVAVNPVTNKIYVSNYSGNNVTVIDGASNATAIVQAGTNPLAVAVNPVSNRIYVANRSSANVTVIDGVTNATATVPAGTGPYAVAVNPLTNKIYVANALDNSVTVIDGATNATSAIPAGSEPLAVAVNPVTNKIYVADYMGNTVTVIDGATNATTTVPVGRSPYSVAVNPVTNKIYVTNWSSNNVTVVDGMTNGTTTVYVGYTPYAVAVNPVTNKIYVANQSSNNVTVIDGTTGTVGATVPAGAFPDAVAVNPVTNKIYVTNQNSNTVTVIDGTTNTTTTVPAGVSPQAAVVNPVTNKIYVTNQNSNTVTVIDGSPFNTANVRTGSRANGIGINPTTNEIYMANWGDSTVSVIDGATGTLSATIPSYGGPISAAVNPVTNKIYVPNYETANVTVIDGATKATTTVPAGGDPKAVDINLVTDKIYVADQYDIYVTVIDGATNATTNVVVGWAPSGVAVNPVTNKIYVSVSSGGVQVIDGATNVTTAVPAGSVPAAVAVNPVTNKIYVMNLASHDVTVIDGATNDTVTIPNVPASPDTPYIAVNSATNKIYVVAGIVTVIDGATNDTTTLEVGGNGVAINSVTNKIYVPSGLDYVSVIDGATNTTTQVPASGPYAIAVNPVTNKIYAGTGGDLGVTVIDESPRISQGYRAAPQPLPDNVSTTLPEFMLDATDALNNPIIPLGVYWQMDTMQGPWGAATANGGNSFSATVTTALTPGSHVLYTYPVQGDAGNPTIDMGTPRMGDVSAYLFTVNGQIAPQQQPQTITFPNPGDQTYGVVSITLTATASSGLAVTYAVTSGRANLSGSNLDVWGGAGSYTVRADQAGDSQWQPAPSQYVTFTVYPAVLTVTADSFTIVDGAPLPTFTASYTGFQFGQGTEVLSGSPSLTTTAPQNPPVGTYPINASQGTLSAANYTFTFVSGTLTVTPVTGQITSPAKGSTLTDSSATFTWSHESGASSYQLWLGHTAGTHDIGATTTANLFATLNNLPTDGSTIYATLYGYASGHWTVQDTATYTAASNAKAVITSPTKGSTLTGSSVTFGWSAEAGATSYQLWVGHSAGTHDLAIVTTSSLSATVNNLPTDGSQVYVSLYGHAGTIWSLQDTASYTAVTNLKAVITSPPKGSTLTSSSVMFGWTSEAGATSYQLWVGHSAGTHDIAVITTGNLSATVNNLPTDGSQLYVTLYGYAGTWTLQDTASYTAAGITKAVITSPLNGSTLSGSTVTFTWTAETGATSYQLWVGHTPGAHDITVRSTSGLSTTVVSLPTDGSLIYVTLYGNGGGGWSVQDTASYTTGP